MEGKEARNTEIPMWITLNDLERVREEWRKRATDKSHNLEFVLLQRWRNVMKCYGYLT